MRSLFGLMLAACCVFFLAHRIDLTTADLGRHIKNGELTLQTAAVLKTNFYSYTNEGFPAVNHHWGSGFLFFLIHQWAGFTGLSLFYLILSAATFVLFYDLARRQSGWPCAFVLACLAIPLLSQRVEIRPEGFSYFFCALFFWILSGWKDSRLKNSWLWALPICEIFWVNTHIYFFFGPWLLGVFLLERPLNRQLLLIFILTCLATLVNPFGIHAALFPAQIFTNYGYKIVENQSVWFLERLKFNIPNLVVFKIVFGVLMASFLAVFIRDRKNFPLGHFLLALPLSAMGWLALRNFTIFGFFSIPLIAGNIKTFFGGARLAGRRQVFGALILSVLIVSWNLHRQKDRNQFSLNSWPLGLVDGVNASAEFFLRENIKGPIFNNYDIGGYLIYHLFPKERVFVDNRPEAYPAAFFKEVYIPMQEGYEAWTKAQTKFNFNAIFFSHRDATPWGQKFLIDRVNDLEWAPVFADQFAIIFLKRSAQNDAVIKKYEVPKDRFRVVRLK